MFGQSKKKETFDDAKKGKFIDAITDILEMQRIAAVNCSIEDSEGHLNRKAIGYIYGFIDAALRSIGQDMGDISIGVPITFQVLNRLFPGRGENYTKFLFETMGKDEVVTLGAMTGGQQWIEKTKPESKGVPMKFGMFLMEGDKR